MDYKIIMLLVIIHILGSVYFYRILRDQRRKENSDDFGNYDWGDVIINLFGCNLWMIALPINFVINFLTTEPPKYL